MAVTSGFRSLLSSLLGKPTLGFARLNAEESKSISDLEALFSVARSPERTQEAVRQYVVQLAQLLPPEIPQGIESKKKADLLRLLTGREAFDEALGLTISKHLEEEPRVVLPARLEITRVSSSALRREGRTAQTWRNLLELLQKAAAACPERDGLDGLGRVLLPPADHPLYDRATDVVAAIEEALQHLARSNLDACLLLLSRAHQLARAREELDEAELLALLSLELQVPHVARVVARKTRPGVDGGPAITGVGFLWGFVGLMRLLMEDRRVHDRIRQRPSEELLEKLADLSFRSDADRSGIIDLRRSSTLTNLLSERRQHNRLRRQPKEATASTVDLRRATRSLTQLLPEATGLKIAAARHPAQALVEEAIECIWIATVDALTAWQDACFPVLIEHLCFLLSSCSYLTAVEPVCKSLPIIARLLPPGPPSAWQEPMKRSLQFLEMTPRLKWCRDITTKTYEMLLRPGAYPEPTPEPLAPDPVKPEQAPQLPPLAAMKIALEMAFADGYLDPDEVELLEDLRQRLGINEVEYQGLFNSAEKASAAHRSGRETAFNRAKFFERALTIVLKTGVVHPRDKDLVRVLAAALSLSSTQVQSTIVDVNRARIERGGRAIQPVRKVAFLRFLADEELGQMPSTVRAVFIRLELATGLRKEADAAVRHLDLPAADRGLRLVVRGSTSSHPRPFVALLVDSPPTWLQELRDAGVELMVKNDGGEISMTVGLTTSGSAPFATLPVAQEQLKLFERSVNATGGLYDFIVMLRDTGGSYPYRTSMVYPKRGFVDLTGGLALADSQMVKGDLQAAARTYMRVMAANPLLHRGFARLGRCAESLGQLDEAREFYKRELLLDRHCPIAREGLARIRRLKPEVEEA
jgi:tetratricopeptide (TPR) repeat protein